MADQPSHSNVGSHATAGSARNSTAGKQEHRSATGPLVDIGSSDFTSCRHMETELTASRADIETVVKTDECRASWLIILKIEHNCIAQSDLCRPSAAPAPVYVE